MLKISDFFKKIQNKHSKELFIRSTIQATIKKFTNVELQPESISIKSSTLTLKGISQTAKSQVYIKKAEILQEINSTQSVRIISDIR